MRMYEIRTILIDTLTFNKLQDTLFESIHTTILLHKPNLGSSVLLIELCEANWKERNEYVYSQFLGRMPSWMILTKTAVHLKAMVGANKTTKKERKLLQVMEEI